MSERPNTLAEAAEASRKSRLGDDPLIESRIAGMPPTPSGGPTSASAGSAVWNAPPEAPPSLGQRTQDHDGNEPAEPLNMMLQLPPRMRMALKVAFQASSRSEGRGKKAFVMFLLQSQLEAYIAEKGLGAQLQDLLLKNGL